MKERPILFSGEMVRAILDGSKTQTRRPIRELRPTRGLHNMRLGPITEFKPSDTPGFDWSFRDKKMRWHDVQTAQLLAACPYGQTGDHLWVRETFAANVIGCESQGGYSYRADHVDPRGDGPANPMRWTPSIHMPRWASRITLEVTSVRAERVQDITNDDALRDGINPLAYEAYESPRQGFRELWERIHGAGAWDRNDWVWVVDFQRVDGASASTNKENCNE